MILSELLDLASALGAGIMLGTIFFGGLWWTVRQGISSSRVAFWFLGSMLLRTCIVLLGFYFFFGNNWKKMLLGLLGFIIARLVVTRLTRAKERPDHSPLET
jgi:F1F0 ATPase subunit 2